MRWSPASFSAAERAMDRTRGREFTADEMVALARGFGLPLLLFLLPPPGARLASADGGPDGLDATVLVDAVICTVETAPALEQSLLAWSAEHGRHAGPQTQLPPWLRARVTQAARRIFGSTGDCASALAKAAALLRALDGIAAG